MPVGKTAMMQIDMSAVYLKNLAVFGTRGMPAWKFPSILDLIQSGAVDLTPLVANKIDLTQASASLRAMDGPTPPGTDVITKFAV
ncbi:MAG: hypothetical protein AAGF71_14765 [Pseudomonadota bacterium]